MVHRFRLVRRALSLAMGAWVLLAAAHTGFAADEIGQIKTSKGAVHIERGGARIPASVGAKVQAADVVVTGADGSVGILFADATLLSAGPKSVLSIDKFAFDSTTNQGVFESHAQEGHAGRHLGQDRQAVTRRDEGADSLGGARGPRHRVRRARESARRLSRAMRAGAGVVLLALLALSSCARPAGAPPAAPARDDLAVLLPGQDGKTGAVSVSHAGTERVLDAPYAAARISEPGGIEPGVSSAEEVNRVFGEALAALPPRPVSFLLYFVEGKDQLTPESAARAPAGLRGDRAAAGAGGRSHRPHRPRGRRAPTTTRSRSARAERVRDDLVARGIPGGPHPHRGSRRARAAGGDRRRGGGAAEPASRDQRTVELERGLCPLPMPPPKTRLRRRSRRLRPHLNSEGRRWSGGVEGASTAPSEPPP